MPRISYYPVEEIVDPELRAILDHAARHGTPRPESQAIRAHAPATLRDFWAQWEHTFRNGICDHAVKELCRVYVSRTVECLYCGNQRSTGGREQGLVERDYDELLDFEASDRYDERQKAALAYAQAIATLLDDVDRGLGRGAQVRVGDDQARRGAQLPRSTLHAH